MMKRIFEMIYPDYGGYHFFSVVVWEGFLELAEEEKHIGWNIPVRIMEARFVVQGLIVSQIMDVAHGDLVGKWDSMPLRAKEIARAWKTDFDGMKTLRYKGFILSERNWAFLTFKFVRFFVKSFFRKFV